MLRLVVLTVMFLSFSALAATTINHDYTPCLKVLNEKSLTFKDKIVPLSPDGWNYLVKNNDGSMSVVAENGSYKLESKPIKCSVSQEFSSLQRLNGLVLNAMTHETSAAAKKEISSQCKDVLGGLSGYGMMVSGAGMMVGGGGMMAPTTKTPEPQPQVR